MSPIFSTLVVTPMIIYFLNLFSSISHLIANRKTYNIHTLLEPSSFRYLISCSLFLGTSTFTFIVLNLFSWFSLRQTILSS